MEQEIVGKLNDAAMILWDGSVRWTVVNAWLGLLGWSVVGAAIVICMRWTWRATTPNPDSYDNELIVMARVICVLVAGLGGFVVIVGLCESIVALIEPIGATVNRLL